MYYNFLLEVIEMHTLFCRNHDYNLDQHQRVLIAFLKLSFDSRVSESTFISVEINYGVPLESLLYDPVSY